MGAGGKPAESLTQRRKYAKKFIGVLTARQEVFMYQDIAPKFFNNQYDPKKTVSPEARVFCFRGKDVLVAEKGKSFEYPKSRIGISPSEYRNAIKTSTQ